MQNRDIEGNVNEMVLEALDNHRTIKAYRVYEFIYSRYRKILEKHYRTTEHANFYDSVFAPMMQILRSLVIAVIIISATAKPAVFGVTVGVLIGFIDLIAGLFSPIETIGMELQTVQTSIAGIRRVNAFFGFEATEKNQIRLQPSSSHVLEFKDVTFRYGENNEVISHFRLKLSGNQHLTIRGSSGAGKSTVFRLAYGILAPTSGTVTIDGIDCYEISPEIRKKLFGILFQETFFSGGTVYEELTLADPTVSEETVWKALKLVGLDRRIENLHHVPRGELSAGEEVLFNLARLIIIDAPIWFLDEMNAKIDPETAAYLIRLISELGKDKMIISINHYGENLQDSAVITLTDVIAGEGE
jgi:ATP-binding cassette subfamily B protein